MKDRTYSESRGIRRIESWSKSPDPKVGWTNTTSTQVGILNYSESFTCVNGTGGTPGRKAPTAYSFAKTRRIYGAGSMIAGDPDLSYTVTTGASFGSAMSPNGSPGPVNTSINNVYNEALGKLSEEVRGNLDLSIDLLQYRQAGSMLGNLRIPKLYNYVRSFHPKRWAGRWLEYQYGWRPLAQSIYDLAHQMSTPPREGLVRFKVRAKEVQNVTRNNSSISGIYDVTKTMYSKRVEIVLALDMKPSFWEAAAGISSLNPASIVWETVPYSFVADWFIDIGGYLRNLENAFLYNMAFKNGYQTIGTYRKDESSKYGSQTTSDTSSTIYTGCVHQVINTTKQRSVLSSYPLPMIPHPKVDLGAQRALSAGSLLLAAFGKGRT